MEREEIYNDFKEALKHINWSTRSIGCGYERLMNHMNEITGFEITPDNKLTSKDKDLFGVKASEHGASGHLNIDLVRCVFEVDKKIGALTILSKEDIKNSVISLSLYNFEDDLTKNHD